VSGAQLASWQIPLARQILAGPAAQLPAEQLSARVHASPSLHASSDRGAKAQIPLAASQLSAVQALPSWQFAAAPGTHCPPAHASPAVQALPSLHGVASTGACTQLPATHSSAVQGFASLQSPSSWQAQVHGPPLHPPPSQLSPVVQATPSSHNTVAALGIAAHAPVLGWQAPVQHGPPPQSSRGPALQLPLPSQLSARVQGLPSSQLPPLWAGVATHAPVATEHAWGAQAEPRQGNIAPLLQFPAPSQASCWVQGLPSLQAMPAATAVSAHSPVAGSQTPARQVAPAQILPAPA
jgi:hypothetical protein